jgi:hypothetical protein
LTSIANGRPARHHEIISPNLALSESVSHLNCMPENRRNRRTATQIGAAFWLVLIGWTGRAQAADPDPARSNPGPSHWAFQPITDPPVPAACGSDRDSRNPIDRFINESLAKRGLHQAGPAEKRTLIRRATFDLIGLPPTSAEVEAFVADDLPDAFERWVDRLMASPQYGERWGRWWLDVARYADSNGQDENKVMANAWRYRDWVVRAFNRDLPFDEFITDQLAGDLLPADGVSESKIFDRWIATGFLVLGPKMLAEQDKPKLVMDIVDEQIDVVSKAFLGLTVACARCHDHKFDPISTREYYALAGIFKSTRAMENLDFVSKFNERIITPRIELEIIEAQEKAVAARTAKIEAAIREAGAVLANQPKAPLPNDPWTLYPAATRAAIQALKDERDSLRSTLDQRQFALSVNEATVTNLPVHIRGSHLNLASDPVPRGFIAVAMRGSVPRPGPRQSGRLELAGWITGAGNPLTSRVIVNRIWQAHFGGGLVRTSDNFGLRGDLPTHPELLDWLARRFVKDGWSMKAMHRLMMTSTAYRQSAEADFGSAGPMGAAPSPFQIDPEDKLLWHFPRQRLEAEMIRDSLLAISGRLDSGLGGTLVHWTNNEYVPGNMAGAASFRRSLYIPIVRDRVDDSLSVFDFANPSVCAASRTPTVVSHQALFFMNSPLVKESARAFARALLDKSDAGPGARVSEAYCRVFGRPPTDGEIRWAAGFLALARQSVKSGEPGEIEWGAWSAFCQALFAANEFIYRD